MPDPLDKHVQQIELKLGILIGLSALQLIVLCLILINSLLPNLMWFFKLIALFLLLCGAGFFFRNQIPGWLGTASRYVFSHLKDPETKI